MPTTSRDPRRAWIPARVRTVLAWCGVGLFGFVLVAATAGPDPVGGRSLGTRLLLPALICLLPFGVARRRPVLTVALLLAGMYAMAVGYDPPLPVPVGAVPPMGAVNTEWTGWYTRDVWIAELVVCDVAVGLVAARRSRRVSLVTAAVALAVQAFTAAAFESDTTILLEIVFVMSLGLVIVWLVGHSVRARRRYAAERRMRAQADAVQAERLRIARELHDIIAHSVGVIAIQAGMGRRVIDSQPKQTRAALAAIEDTSRDTLAGLRRMLVGLRRAGSDAVESDPAPGLADLDALVDRCRETGLRVEVRWEGERPALPPDIDLSAYRVVQEAVTNVVRHAGAGRCDVVVACADGELRIEVTDDGRGGEGVGYGIAGMRERVGLLGGEFDAGRRAEGGFRVAARIPVPVGAA